MYNVEPLPSNKIDYKTICEAFRSTRYPYTVYYKLYDKEMKNVPEFSNITYLYS